MVKVCLDEREAVVRVCLDEREAVVRLSAWGVPGAGRMYQHALAQ